MTPEHVVATVTWSSLSAFESLGPIQSTAMQYCACMARRLVIYTRKANTYTTVATDWVLRVTDSDPDHRIARGDQ